MGLRNWLKSWKERRAFEKWCDLEENRLALEMLETQNRILKIELKFLRQEEKKRKSRKPLYST